jgi:hypothetical protein
VNAAVIDGNLCAKPVERRDYIGANKIGATYD